jgi:hypothetical protein
LQSALFHFVQDIRSTETATSQRFLIARTSIFVLRVRPDDGADAAQYDLVV